MSDVSLTNADARETLDAPLAETDRRARGVTPRVVVLCLALAALFGVLIPIIDLGLANTFLGAAHLPPGAIAVLLLILLAVNPLARLFSARLKFSRNEILTIYITTLFSCLVPGHGSENFFVSNLVGPYYFANASNKWMDFLGQNVQPWLTPALTSVGFNRDAVDGWYIGTQGVVPWAAWIGPLVAWSALILASYVMLGCLSIMLRAQWAEREALSFPLLRLPIELTEGIDDPGQRGMTPFFRNPMVWIGIGIAFAIQLSNGLNFYFTDFPKIPLSIDTSKMFTEAPWNQIGGLSMRVLPIVVGISFLLTSEVSFSLWFFFLFMKFQLIASFALGYAPNAMSGLIGHTMGAKPFVGYQQIGALLGYALLVLWAAREHFRHIGRRAFGRIAASKEEASEALSYPAAFWGFVVAFVFIVAWTWFAGVNLLISLYMWSAYLLIAVALTRVIAEGGLLFVQQGWIPMSALAPILGSGAGTLLPASTVVPGAFVQSAMMTDLRGFLMPSFIQGFKLAHDRGIRARPLFVLICAVILISFTLSIFMNVSLGYQRGGLTLEPWFAQMGAQKPAVNAKEILSSTITPSAFNVFWVGLGGALTWGMMIARSHFVWFPFHPIGYVMGLSYPMTVLWFSIFLGWLCKVLITRFGGSDTYSKTTPLFLGVVLGDVISMLMWLCVDGFTGQMNHQLMVG